MRPFVFQVDEESYRELKSLARRMGRPVAQLIRQAIAGYIAHHRAVSASLFDLDLEPHRSGALRAPWTRADLVDERLRR